MPAILLKRDYNTGIFLEYSEILNNSFFYVEHLCWLILYFQAANFKKFLQLAHIRYYYFYRSNFNAVILNNQEQFNFINRNMVFWSVCYFFRPCFGSQYPVIDVVLVFLLLTLNIFHTLF